MAPILQALNDEWATIARTNRSRQTVRRWATVQPVLDGPVDLAAVLEVGLDPDRGPQVRRALVELAATDDLAARTLLQGLLGGLCNLARHVGRDDTALDDIVALAWERIRTYPLQRPGTVSGNVLLDVRKQYRATHELGDRDQRTERTLEVVPSAEDVVLSAAAYEDLLASVGRCGVPDDVVVTIVRSRVGGVSMAELAAEQSVSLRLLWQRRWRAEARLRQLPLAS